MGAFAELNGVLVGADAVAVAGDTAVEGGGVLPGQNQGSGTVSGIGGVATSMTDVQRLGVLQALRDVEAAVKSVQRRDSATRNDIDSAGA